MDDRFLPKIGKDVIESLTLGMYDDPRFIYREYIQNSADQIDKAIEIGLLSKNEGSIHISISAENSKIEIEDDATGIPAAEVENILLNIAQSIKTRGVNKGFRGIGRLGGLAYCEKLIFETSYMSEKQKTRVLWDSKLLKKILNNRSQKEEATSVIKSVASIEVEEADSSSHFFKVILEGVSNTLLLDLKEVKKYLSLVAPIPFPTKFYFKSKISEDLKKFGINLDEYKIFLNTELLFKDYTTYIYKGDEEVRKKEDEIVDIEFIYEKASDGELLYWGWYSISKKLQSLNQINNGRGLRLRKSNIQIGDEYTLQKFHRDKRFQFYFVGEIHALHPELIPNSRRDYFTENDYCKEFEKKIKLFFHSTIYKLCYSASEINSSVKKIEEFTNFQNDFQQKNIDGFTSFDEHDEYRQALETKHNEAVKAQKKLEKIKRESHEMALTPIKKVIDGVAPVIAQYSIPENLKIIDHQSKPKLRTTKLSALSREQQKFLGRIFGIIKKVLDKSTAENLILKIEEELK